MHGGCRTAAPPNNRVIYYILLAFVSKHVPILKLSSIPIKFKVISSSAVRELSFSYSKQLTYWCHFLLRWTASTFYDSNTRAFSLPLLLSCGRYRTAFSAAKELYSAADCVCPVHVRSQLNVLKCMFLFIRIKWFQVYLFILYVFIYIWTVHCAAPLSVISMSRHWL